MKKLLLSLICILCVTVGLKAQTIAPDWTKSDCAGNEHHLYSELDNGGIVIMDFAMTYMDYPKTTAPCPSCSTATAILTRLHNEYDQTNPGRLRHYAMAYTNAYSCADLQSWQDDLGFSVPSITACAADVKAYGGMGMPTIAVVAGADHKVIYKKVGFVPKDTIAMKAAINLALANAGVTTDLDASHYGIVEIAGKPSLRLDLSAPTSLNIEILDMLGRPVKVTTQQEFSTGEHQQSLLDPGMPSGKYIARVSSKDGHVISLPFVVTH